MRNLRCEAPSCFTRKRVIRRYSVNGLYKYLYDIVCNNMCEYASSACDRAVEIVECLEEYWGLADVCVG